MYWKQWLKMLLGLTTVMGILELLLPEGNLSKFSRLVLGLVLMLAILQPFTILFDLNPEKYTMTILDQKYPQTRLAEDSDQLRTVAMQPFLKNEKFNASKKIEGLLLTLEAIEDIEVIINEDAHILIKLKPLTSEIENRVMAIVERSLNISSSQISIVEMYME